MPLLPYVLKGGLHVYSFVTKLFTMPGPKLDIFDTLLSPDMHSDIASFVDRHYQCALLSNEPSHSMQARFSVTFVGLNKAGMPAQHESIAIRVIDTMTDKKHEFIIERNPSDRSHASRFSSFCSFPQSEAVLDSLQAAVRNMRLLTTQAAEALFAATRTETENIPLLPLTHSQAPLQPSYPTTPPTNPAQLSLIDMVTSTLAGAVASARRGSQSISPQKLADDSISGCQPNPLIPEHCIRRFKPVALSLFDIVLLAQVVHDYAPIYGLFDNQCYMFASVIFDSIVKEYSLPASNWSPNPPPIPRTPVPAPSPEVGGPSNANIVVLPSPDQAGRWAGLLVIDPIVKATIVSLVISQFHTERDSYIAAVNEAAATRQ